MVTYAGASDESDKIGEDNDCSVKALAVVTGLDYADVHTALSIAGRAYGKGTPNFIAVRALKSLGFRVRRVYTGERLGLELGVRRPTVADLEESELPPLYVIIHKHALAFRDRRVHDWSRNAEAQIQEAWELERIDRQRKDPGPPPVVYL